MNEEIEDHCEFKRKEMMEKHMINTVSHDNEEDFDNDSYEIENKKTVKKNTVLLGHEDADHEMEIKSIIKDEMDIIQLEKSIQQLKVEFDNKKKS
jgi:hypothetical protein